MNNEKAEQDEFKPIQPQALSRAHPARLSRGAHSRLRESMEILDDRAPRAEACAKGFCFAPSLLGSLFRL